jgi:hypothetical protein
MSDDLGKGDVVICVDVTPKANKEASAWMCSFLILNAQYTIRKVVKDGREKGVHLEEISLGVIPEIGYYAERFRRLSKNDDFQKVLESLKKPWTKAPEGPVKTPEKIDA